MHAEVTRRTADLRRRVAGIVAAGLVWGAVVDAGFAQTHGMSFAVPSFLGGAAFLVAGGIAHVARPEHRAGRLLLATGLLYWVADLWAWGTVLESSALWTAGELLRPAYIFPLAYLVLSFPGDKLPARIDLWLWRATWVIFGALYTAVLLVNGRGAAGCQPCPLNLAVIPGTEAVRAPLQAILGLLAMGYSLALIVRFIFRWARASAPGRRILSPVILAAVFALVTIFAYGFRPVDNRPILLILATLNVIGYAAIPFGFLVGLLRARGRRARVADFVVEVTELPQPEQLRGGLRRVLGDPTVEVAFWVAPANRYLTSDGRPFHEEDERAAGRAVTLLERQGAPIAALSHDPALFDDPGLVEAVKAATLLVLHNEQLQHELREQLDQVRASRARLVAAADEERRRIERDIHDGAQQRLVSLSMALRYAESKLGDGSDPAVVESLRAAAKEAHEALAELRDLARGIHPSVLTDRGLAPALRFLAQRIACDVDLNLDLPPERLPRQTEAAAYFVASEALANIAKHAAATNVVLTASVADGNLAMTITDDGQGGASAEKGSGLSGLADRVQALDGTLMVHSVPGEGTTVRATLPCA